MSIEADADVYVGTYCENRCAKYDECAPIPEQFGECSVSSCIEELTDEFDDPCFAEWDEFRRCLIERETCDEYFDMNIQTHPGSICHDLFVVFSECRSEHPGPTDD